MNILVVGSPSKNSPLIIALEAALVGSGSTVNLTNTESFRPDRPIKADTVVFDCTAAHRDLFNKAARTPVYLRMILAPSRDQVPNGFRPDAGFFFINENGVAALA
ncbi:MAG: hypothetical protein V1664_05460 [Candidatus Uhrbacteria bacterium]